ncbi:Van1 protein [Saccharomycopsis crataegensis]|uniref:Van1 protein n=1 Tax=Saccharomycopsis crataegensis TaxID=43959 RepID=A0AAV5QTX8_9ASCO|nr:Van1 protein [Saccharomycopsis crataegensis]
MIKQKMMRLFGKNDETRSNKKSDLPISESDKFKPLRHSRRQKLVKVSSYLTGMILVIYLLVSWCNRNPQAIDIEAWSLYHRTAGFFSGLSHDITNWQQDQDELKFPDSKGGFSALKAEEMANTDDYRHYTVTADGVKEEHRSSMKEVEDELHKTVAYYDLNEFQGHAEGSNQGDVVLLLIPLRNAEHVLPLMFKHLMNLDYPHSQIDIGFLVSDCSPGDRTLNMLFEYSILLQNGSLMNDLVAHEQELRSQQLQGSSDLYLKYMPKEYLDKISKQFKPPYHKEFDKPFRSVQIFEKNFGQVIGQGFSDRHAVKVQGIRRKLMGRARNWLISTTLKPYHSWVFWRDADIEEAPSSVIQDLMKFDFDVIVPNVWRPLPEFLGSEQPYDLNTWIESPPALELAATLDEDDVIVEGYAEYPTYRVHLAYLKENDGDKNAIIEMDGVGGVSILAKARVFRQGVTFPAFTFENHAETEAFGKMARKMGFKVGGLPHYVVWHIYEPSEDDLKEIASKERKKRRQKHQ